ncbi:AAA family ATPase [Heliobacterium chlorum]|uniref:AAA family ATPase n=1 Tax=Heliobacterium chlorum TaxID=2698 RepID=A0ABR7T849_HELCL|nr:AAA family ATPase [Heliobacterium chlorum]MBC9786570.1 AAA family ATPase [Heliobacterium chlorum]
MKIALTGKMRSGKDAAADYLVNHYGFRKFAFGDAIRNLCKELFPHADEDGKPRALFQDVGQALREVDPDVWVNYVLRQIERETGPDDDVVITDLRQWNEYLSLLEAGFDVVKINSSATTRIQRMKRLGEQINLAQFNHETEKFVEQIDADFEITNEGTLKELYCLIDNALLHIKEEAA